MSNGVDNNSAKHIAYLGPRASFSHQAALNIFKETANSNVYPLSSFSDIFASLQASHGQSSRDDLQQSYDYGVIPVENSTNGSVVQVYDLLVQIPKTYPDLEIIAEYYLPVHHCLFTNRNTASNGSTDAGKQISQIQTLYTHPQVWGQCTRYLQEHFPKVERIDCSSTSAAAKLVSKDSSGTTAAIASRLAGENNDLECLAQNIEDEPEGNTTRFFVIRNKTSNSSSEVLHTKGRASFESTLGAGAEVKYKSMITFTVSHTQPGALADVLAVFKDFHFNLRSIDTRPSRKRNWEYVFFVECEEMKRLEEGGRLQDLLQDVGRRTEECRWLGRWIDMLWLKELDGARR